MRKVKIGYYCADVNPDKTKSLGIYKTTKEILKQLLINKKLEVVLILSEESQKYFNEFSCTKEVCKSDGKYVFNKLFKYPSFANRVANKKDLDILLFPKGHIPFFKNSNIKYISIIHDLIPIYYFRRGKFSMIISSFLLWWSAKFSDLIFTDSNYSKGQINKISKKPVVVIPLGYTHPKKVIRPKIKGDYVFVIGNKNPHKNLEISIRLMKEYSRRFNRDYKLVTSNGSLTEPELAGLYKYAEFCIFLSDIEGFGLPLIESYYWKTPVVFNNKTSLAEIGKGLPGACDVDNKESVFNAIRSVETLATKELDKIRNGLEKEYSWKTCGVKIAEEL